MAKDKPPICFCPVFSASPDLCFCRGIAADLFSSTICPAGASQRALLADLFFGARAAGDTCLGADRSLSPPHTPNPICWGSVGELPIYQRQGQNRSPTYVWPAFEQFVCASPDLCFCASVAGDLLLHHAFCVGVASALPFDQRPCVSTSASAPISPAAIIDNQFSGDRFFRRKHRVLLSVGYFPIFRRFGVLPGRQGTADGHASARLPRAGRRRTPCRAGLPAATTGGSAPAPAAASALRPSAALAPPCSPQAP